MTGILRAIGVDPGPTPGMVELRYENGRLVGHDVVQCSHGIAADVFRAMLRLEDGVPTLVQIEKFVVKRQLNHDQRLTNDMVASLTRDVVAYGKAHAVTVNYALRNAGLVKPWATDARLDAVRLLEPLRGMRHARDAARHALYIAVKDGRIPDPLSKRSQANS